ncbi:putative RNA methyltransferase [uncultured Dysosmobacter sp.]|uniref:putative RNA methyltransferase n=1 Tax=uncultured Dysosmobacter sp. TaxID=2591384 RepID=UPI00261BC4BB|nr:methyltransferase domain-containing protein [uncultured Dysosmobacter sp.]
MSLFRCPVCGGPLDRGEHACRCPAGHSYDIAKEGYIYLLPPNQKHSAAPGDDKGMAQARRAFLSKGYYAPLLEALCREVLARSGNGPAILDTGCGEGYYTAGIYQALQSAGKAPRMVGTDISKAILRLAAKRERGVEFAVASSYHLPLADGSVDTLLNCFSPLALEEFRRVLKPAGTFLYVVPAADHLWELKQVLYDRPYPNEEKETPYEGFAYEAIVPVEDTITLESQADIHALFQMTPYYWKTPRAGAERLASLETLTARIAFRIHIFRKL